MPPLQTVPDPACQRPQERHQSPFSSRLKCRGWISESRCGFGSELYRLYANNGGKLPLTDRKANEKEW